MATSDRGSDDLHDEGTFDLRDVLATARRRKWVVAAVTLCIANLAAFYSFTRVPVYTSQARVLVRPILTSPFQGNPLQQLSLQTEMQLVASSAVANVVKQQMDSPLDVQALLRHVSVTAPENTQILDISYSDPDPATAQKGAQAFADAYLEFKRRQALGSITEYTTTLQPQIQSLDQEITTLNQRISRLPQGTPAWMDTLNRRDALTASRLALQTQFATLSTLSVDPGEIIQPGQLPASPSSPKHELDLALGVLLGLLFGVGFAAVHERVHDRILGRRELEQCLDAPVLGVIPRVPGLRSMPARLVTVERPRGGPAEAYRTLRTNFLAANPPVKSVLVTSAQAGEGKTTTAANLATALALLGKRVTLISADLRHPRVHKFFDVPNDAGLSQVLSGDIGLTEALHSTAIPHLQVLPSGPVTSIMEPVELLQSDRMSGVLAQCGGAEFILIDGPPVLAVADSLALAEMVDGVLVVVNARKGKRALVIQARYQLRQVGGRLLGGVLNGSDLSKMGLGYYSPYDYHRGFLFLHRLLVSGAESNSSKEPTTIAGTVPTEPDRGSQPMGGRASGRRSSRSRRGAQPEGGETSAPGPTEPDLGAQPEGGETSAPGPTEPDRGAQPEGGEASAPGPMEPDRGAQPEGGETSVPGPTEPDRGAQPKSGRASGRRSSQSGPRHPRRRRR